MPTAAIVLLTALSASAEAREISVKPGQNLRGIVGAARAGDTVNVAAGTYVAALSIPSGIRLVSKDGPGNARIDGGGRGETIAIYHRRDIVIDGFEIFHSGENIVKIEGSRNITLRHCKIHDAGEDCVKATIGSQFITVEECEIYNPGRHADDGRYEQNVDFMDTERAVVRRCLLYHVGGHGDQIGFFKAESKVQKYKPGGRGCVFEQNVVLNAGGGPNDSPAFTLGQESDSEWRHGQHACYDAIVRDNVFVNCRNGAIGFYGCYGGYAYGNVIINSGPPFGFHGAGVGVRPAIDLVFIVNNAVLNPAGNLERMFEGRQNLDGRMTHDFNLVWNGGKTPPTDAHEPHGDGRRPPLPAVMTASPAEGYAVLAARFAALAPHRAAGEALLPAAAHAGDPDRGLPVSSAIGAVAEHPLEYLPLQGARSLCRFPNPPTSRRHFSQRVRIHLHLQRTWTVPWKPSTRRTPPHPISASGLQAGRRPPGKDHSNRKEHRRVITCASTPSGSALWRLMRRGIARPRRQP